MAGAVGNPVGSLIPALGAILGPSEADSRNYDSSLVLLRKLAKGRGMDDADLRTTTLLTTSCGRIAPCDELGDEEILACFPEAQRSACAVCDLAARGRHDGMAGRHIPF